MAEAENKAYRWIRPDGVEESFPDQHVFQAKVLAGEIGDGDLVREPGSGSWVRAAQVRLGRLAVGELGDGDPSNSLSHQDTPGTAAGEAHDERPGWERADAPWRRYFARMFDFTLAVFVVVFLLMLMPPKLLAGENTELFVTLLALLTVFPFLDAVTLSEWHTSPGKWLLSVRTIRPSGETLSFGVALGRAYKLLGHGVWFGLPILGLLPLARAHARTTRCELQPWETSSGTRTEVRPLGAGVVLYIALVVLGFVLFLA